MEFRRVRFRSAADVKQDQVRSRATPRDARSEYVAHRTRCGARTGSARRGRSVVGDAAGALAKHVVDACADRPLGLDASRAEVDQVVKLFTLPDQTSDG